MKVAYLFLFLSMLCAFADCLPDPSSRGCAYILGRCSRECEEGTHSYNSACRSPTWSRKTCAEPVAIDMGPICDLSRCDCDEPTIWDESTQKCVQPEDCPKLQTQE